MTQSWAASASNWSMFQARSRLVEPAPCIRGGLANVGVAVHRAMLSARYRLRSLARAIALEYHCSSSAACSSLAAAAAMLASLS
eukprot:746620-Rhodomonas_salina.1